MAGYADFMSQRPGLPGPEQGPFDQMLQDVFGRMQQFKERFPRDGERSYNQRGQQQDVQAQLIRSMQGLDQGRGY